MLATAKTLSQITVHMGVAFAIMYLTTGWRYGSHPGTAYQRHSDASS